MPHAAILRLLIAGALALAVAPASAKVLIIVDKSAQQMDVSVDGVHRWTFPVSTGVPRYDTPSGSYRAFRMEADHFSKEWDDAPMPHSIFFTPQGHAIHGYLNTKNIGNPASHGCVRLEPANAAKLFALVEQQGVTNATVVLKGDVQIAMANRATRTVGRNTGVVADVTSAQPPGFQTGYEDRGYAAARAGTYQQPAPAYGYQQQAPAYGYQQQPQYEPRSRAEYGRTYDNCPMPPPGFPVPACAQARMAQQASAQQARAEQARADQARAEQYPARRYDYGQPQYEPDAPSGFFGRPRSSYGY